MSFFHSFWNPSTSICENSNYLKSIADTSVTECDEIIIFIDIVSTKKGKYNSNKKINVTSTALINFQCRKVRDCYILHAVLIVIILLLIITIICYHYAKKRII